MASTIRDALLPILLINCVLGLMMWDYRKFHLNVVYVAGVWSFYLYCYYYVMIRLIPVTDFQLVLILSFVYANFISLIVAAYFNWCNKRRLYTCLEEFCAVDDTLEMLGISKEYKKVREFTVKAFGIWTLIYSVLCMARFAEIMIEFNDFFAGVFCVIVYYLSYLSSLTYLTFSIYLGYSGTRFDRVNECLQKLLDECTSEKRSIAKRTITVACANPYRFARRTRILWTAMHLHLQLCKTSQELNKVFDKQLCLGIACCFTFMINTAVQYYLMFVQSNNRPHTGWGTQIMMYAWVMMYLASVLVPNITYENANATKAIVDKLANVIEDTEIHKEVSRMMLYTMRKPMKFTAMGMSNFGYDMIRRFAASFTTVFIIIIQMSSTPKIQFQPRESSRNESSS